MSKTSDERVVREIETAIKRLDKEGLSDSQIRELMAAKGVPPDRTQALLNRMRTERRQGLLRDGIGSTLLGIFLVAMAAASWLDLWQISIMRQQVVAFFAGATGVVLILGGIYLIILSSMRPGRK